MIQVEVPYGEVCPNKNIKTKYDVCKECGKYKSLSKTFVTCNLNNQALQMTQEDKELLLKDLCARLPYMVKCRQFKLNSQICTLTADLLDKVDNLEPYLRPMSSMTEEERNELSHYENSVQRTDFFYSHHIDCRFMIEKGLALEAPEGMYNI